MGLNQVAKRTWLFDKLYLGLCFLFYFIFLLLDFLIWLWFIQKLLLLQRVFEILNFICLCLEHMHFFTIIRVLGSLRHSKILIIKYIHEIFDVD